MKNKKKSKYKINYLLIFCGCVLFCALSFCGEKEEAARAAEAKEPKASEESGETILKISETAGTPGANGAVLTEVRYDESMYMDMLVKFVFSDGKVVEWKSKYSPYTVKAVECLDLTGDGVKEVLLWGYFTNTAGEYNMLNIFQIEGGEVKEMLFWDDIEELRDKVCHTNLFYTGRGGRQGYALQIETWGKEGACVFLEQEMEIYYEGGRWRKLPGRNIKPQVSLESDREEARLYEAFLRGECHSGESESCRYAAVYCHLALIDFCFQDVLDSVLAEFYQCLIGDKTIYAYRIFEDAPGDVLEHTLGYIEENEEQLGKKFFSYETMLALCDAQERKLGIADHDSKENKVRWHKLQGCEEYTADYRHTSFCSSSAMEIVCSNTVLMELILSI